MLSTGLQNFLLENNEFRKYLVPDSSNNLFLPKSDSCSVLHSDGKHTGWGWGEVEKGSISNSNVLFPYGSMSLFLFT